MPYLDAFWDRPLQDYATFLYDVPGTSARAGNRHDALLRLRRLVDRVAMRSGASAADAVAASAQLAEAPVIQTGPHCHLLAEPDAFYTHLFILLGASAHARGWHICYSASTVKFIARAGKGPGWLRLAGELTNVFGLSRNKMDGDNICGIAGPYRFKMSGRASCEPVNPSAAQLKSLLPTAEFGSAADAIKSGNQVLWQRSFPPSIRLLQFDDADVAELVADHLEGSDSWLSRCFIGNGLFADGILRDLDQLNQGPWQGWIPRTTDLFWGLLNGRIRPLRLTDGRLSDGSQHDNDIPFSREPIAAALRQRKLLLNLLTTFLVISILPGVRALGGCRQVIYYPLMRYLPAAQLARSDDRGLLQALAADRYPGSWGHRVLKPEDVDPAHALLFGQNIADLAKALAAHTLSETSGDLESFTHDPNWARLSARISNGEISRHSPEWLNS